MSPPSVARSLTISRLAERAGLLPAPPRRASGYRDYPADSVPRLRFIRRAKELGFTLNEIGELLALSGRRSQPGRNSVREVKQAAQAKLAVVDHKLAELQRVRDGLHQLIEACPGHGALHDCPILQALSGETA